MKDTFILSLALVGMAAVCGCAHYEYRLVQPAASAQRIGEETVTVSCPPLEYRFARRDDHVAVRVDNPTENTVTLEADKSCVVDPQTESHPLHGAAIAPHSYLRMLLPPAPLTFTTYGYAPYPWFSPYGYYGWGGYAPYPFWPYYNEPIIAPYSYSYRLVTPYHWDWKEGEVQLHLSYQSAGTNFVHTFDFLRQRVK